MQIAELVGVATSGERHPNCHISSS